MRSQARHRRLQLGERLAPVEVLAAVAVAVDREEDLGLDLGEAVDRRWPGRSRASSSTRPRRCWRWRGRRRSPRGCSACRRRRGRRARPRARAGRRRRAATWARSSPQLSSLELAQLGGVQDRRLGVVLAGEDVLGVVEAGAGEPLGAGHLAARRARSQLAVGLDARRSPRSRTRRPRGRRPTSARARRRSSKSSPRSASSQRMYSRQARALDQLGGGLPELLGCAGAHSRRGGGARLACSRSSSCGSCEQSSVTSSPWRAASSRSRSWLARRCLAVGVVEVLEEAQPGRAGGRRRDLAVVEVGVAAVQQPALAGLDRHPGVAAASGRAAGPAASRCRGRAGSARRSKPNHSSPSASWRTHCGLCFQWAPR